LVNEVQNRIVSDAPPRPPPRASVVVQAIAAARNPGASLARDAYRRAASAH
jgi:hypothetical protein